ncbi:hypothetical protein CRM22_008956 [Opisthorchis felineus]|uniref:UPF0506 domain-containing protein n=1 Tax=Opisthorchis felineus TaxID=147828 RepID=A0A4S2L9N2_OPIFE|nr:hypothetical protein CRM22_008956 [Opisthorchis felineus]
MQIYVVLCYLVATLLTRGAALFECKNIGQWCDGTIFNRCCGNLRCQLSDFALGTCKTCVDMSYPCARNEHCCSGRCEWFQCQPY